MQTGGFSFGCSHSAYERVIWDPTAKKYVAICENDAPTGGLSGRIAIAPNTTTTSTPKTSPTRTLGNVLAIRPRRRLLGHHHQHARRCRPPRRRPSPTSCSCTSRPARPARQHHRRQRLGPQRPRASPRLASAITACSPRGRRRPRPAIFSRATLPRKLYVQALNASTGAPEGTHFNASPGVLGSRYQDFRSFPDGSVAYPSPSSTAAANTKIKIARVMPCPVDRAGLPGRTRPARGARDGAGPVRRAGGRGHGLNT